jgi:hypothetical protein
VNDWTARRESENTRIREQLALRPFVEWHAGHTWGETPSGRLTLLRVTFCGRDRIGRCLTVIPRSFDGKHYRELRKRNTRLVTSLGMFGSSYGRTQ